jgi:eukaryotic-like serine/threonine-protein kinase
MRARPNPVEALLKLPRLLDEAEQRASFRQAVTALGQSVVAMGPPPLDGVDLPLLELSAQVALDRGLADDLDWIAPGSAAIALYELMTALPPGRVRREYARRVFARLYEGTAATFTTVAARMALGSTRTLDAPTLRARVSLVLDLPIGTSVNADALALSLVTRPELAERWFERPSTGGLAARRLSAKLLEHAAREAVLRSQQGDPHPRELITGERLRYTSQRLLLDREPLVWRHAAVARGLLATVDPRVREEIDFGLDPTLSPTEWRRASVSLVASLVGGSEETQRACRRLLGGELAERDPGLVATMTLGLPSVIEAEPDAAEALLEALSATARPDVAEAISVLLSQLTSSTFGRKAAAAARDVLAGRSRAQNSILRGVAARALHLIDGESSDDTTLHEALQRALAAYESNGARAAFDAAVAATSHAQAALDFIEAHDPLDETGMPAVLGVLEDLDGSLLDRTTLSNLLLLGRRPGDADTRVAAVDRIHDRVGRWVLAGEERAEQGEWSKPAALANQRRLRALLHMVDLEGGAEGDSDEHVTLPLVRRATRLLLKRLANGPDAMVHRIICATLARSFDAAVRLSAVEPSDVLLAVAQQLGDHHSVATIAEASTNPDVSGPLAIYARFLDPRVFEDGELAPEAMETALSVLDPGDLGGRIAARVAQLARGLSAGGSYRAEALRRVLSRLARSLEAVSSARGLTDLVDIAGSDAIDELEEATEALRTLAQGACRRLLEDESQDISITTDVAALSLVLEGAVRSGIPANPEQLRAALAELVEDIPSGLGSAMTQILARLEDLPVSAKSDVYAIPLEKRRTALPDWLLPRRTMGAFYVMRALGAGGTGSVFVARRLEERHNASAQTFALKVPDYDPTTARSLSEQEFLQLFREEAGALLSLPQHPNLARFVTFDLGARPKPMLVMELISGLSMDRLIRSRALELESACSYLDEILSGLQAMHSVGVGHLDLKPSNVILKDGETPVLVDFGLSGRHLRPGCGTLEYCAPEVLGVCPEGHTPTPAHADAYAFACMAYELLTGELLFDAEDEMALVAQHVGHDGWPDRLARLTTVPAYSNMCVVLAACLRRDPRLRPNVRDLRRAFLAAAHELKTHTWPLNVRRVAQASTA